MPVASRLDRRPSFGLSILKIDNDERVPMFTSSLCYPYLASSCTLHETSELFPFSDQPVV